MKRRDLSEVNNDVKATKYQDCRLKRKLSILRWVSFAETLGRNSPLPASEWRVPKHGREICVTRCDIFYVPVLRFTLSQRVRRTYTPCNDAATAVVAATAAINRARSQEAFSSMLRPNNTPSLGGWLRGSNWSVARPGVKVQFYRSAIFSSDNSATHSAVTQSSRSLMRVGLTAAPPRAAT